MHSSVGRRYFLWLAVGFLCGIFYGLRHHITRQFFPVFLFYSGAFLFLFLLIFLGLRLFCRRPLLFYTDLWLIWFLLLSFCLGLCRVYLFESVQFRTLQNTAGKTVQYIGVLTDDPSLSSTGKTLGFPVKVLFIEEDETRTPCKGNVMLYAKSELSSNLKSGQMISFSGNFTPPEGAPYPGGFSTRDRLYSQGFCFSEYIQNLTPLEEVYHPTPFDWLRDLGRRLQTSLLDSIDSSFSNKNEESALLKGILLGVRDDFTPEQYRQFTDSGLVHITAVSGMHVMFLTGFLTFFFRKLHLPKLLSRSILAASLVLFCSIAAFTPSVCRAVIVMLLFILAQLVQREPDSLTSLSAAAVILLIINPYTMTSYSFILSFSSALGLLLFAAPVNQFFLSLFRQKSGKEKPVTRVHTFFLSLFRSLLSSFSVSLSCTLFLGYFSARFFRRISWGSLLANLFLLPLSSAAFILGFLNWPLSCLAPSLAHVLAEVPLRLILWLINQIAALFSLPVFCLSTGTPPESAIFPYGFILYALWQFLQPRPNKAWNIPKNIS